MRALLVTALLLSAPPSRAGEVRVRTNLSGADVVVNFFLLPLAFAYSGAHQGFEPWPYGEGAAGYGNGDRPMALSVRTSLQSVPGGGAAHGSFRVRGANRLGWDVAASGFRDGVLVPSRRGGYYSGHVTGNYVQNGRFLLEFGLGGASYQDPAPRGGGSAELALEAFPAEPWTFGARWQAAAIHGKGFHDGSAWVGAALGPVGVFAGYRALLTPFGDHHGPEAGLSLWF